MQNIDIAPTVLQALNVPQPEDADWAGDSFLPLLRNEKVPWREYVLYEYHWEWNFPATPTMLAIRTESHKYVYYHGA